MANVKYGVNILPKTNNTYTIGNSDYKWSNIYANQINSINISDILTKNNIDNTGITAKTYTAHIAEFTVTTATSSGHTIPYVNTNIAGRFSKEYYFRVTYDGTQYILKSQLWFEEISDSVKTYEYLGNLAKYITDNTFNIKYTNCPFLIISDRQDNGKLEIWTTEAGEHTFTIEIVSYTYEQFPNTLIWGGEWSPIQINNRTGSTYDAISIGLNEITGNPRSTIVMGLNNHIEDNGFSRIIGNSNKVLGGSQMYVIGQDNSIKTTISCIIGQDNFVRDPINTSRTIKLDYVIGYSNTVKDDRNYVFGEYNVANGTRNCLIGDSNKTNTTSQYNSLFGVSNECGINTSYCVSLGFGTLNKGSCAIVLGRYNVGDTILYSDWAASTSYSVGDIVLKDYDAYECIQANSDSSFSKSKWTELYKTTKFGLIFGNGTGSSDRSNAMAIDWNGNQYLKGDLYIGCNADSTGGTKVASIENPQFLGSISLGRDTTSTIGTGSVATGTGVIASGSYSHAEGSYTQALDINAHAEGSYNVVDGKHSHIEGQNNIVVGNTSHGEGLGVASYGSANHVQGLGTTAQGSIISVSGINNVPPLSSVQNWTASTSYAADDIVYYNGTYFQCTEANSDSAFNISKWTIYIGPYLEVVGNGEFNIMTGVRGTSSNARTLDLSGNEYLKGDLYVGCNADSSGGKKVATINDISNLITPWKLIREGSATNASDDTIEITVDDNGNPFELTDFMFVLSSPNQQTEAVLGSYGRVYFYYGGTYEYDTAYFSSYTQAAGGSPKTSSALCEQRNGLRTFQYITNTTTGGDLAPKVHANNIPPSTADGWTITDNIKIYTKVVVASAKGTFNFRLYGKRKQS